MANAKRQPDEWDAPVETTDWKSVRETELVRKAEKVLFKRFSDHMAHVRENINALLYIEQALLEGDIESAREAFDEMDEDAQIALTLATTKGGWFSVEERKLLKGA